MSLLQVFSVHDEAVDAFMQPIFLRSQGEAVRALRLTINDRRAEHVFAQSPKDYALYYLGVFDESSGKFTQKDVPELVVRLSALVEKGE